MYLRRLHIKNLKRARDITLDLDPRPDAKGGPRGMWTVLIGRNGTGKTTLLQAAALASVGRVRASELAGSLIAEMPDIRHRAEPRVRIEADFDFGRLTRQWILPRDSSDRTPTGLRSTLIKFEDSTEFNGRADFLGPFEEPDITDPDADFSPDDPLVHARSKEQHLWFTAGYGVHRRLPLPGTLKRQAKPSIDRLRSLFPGDQPAHALTSLEFVRHLPDTRRRQYESLLKTVLVDDPEHDGPALVPGLEDLRFDDRPIDSPVNQARRYEACIGGVWMPMTWLSSGYQTLLAALTDLIGQVIDEAKTEVQPDQMEGMVLIDELDLFIHPDWQVGLIPALKRTFPRMQFIVTTHSPLLLSSLRPEEVVVLDLDDGGNIQANPLDVDPRLMTSTELYRRIFDVEETPPDPIFTDVKRYEFLCATPYRTDEQEAERKKLRFQLRKAGVRRIAEPVKRKPRPPMP